jgi:hypothetical protein
VRAARVVEMHVRIDRARKQEEPARIELGARRPGELRPERGDAAVRDRHIAERTPDQQVDHAARRASVPASTATPRSMSSGAVYSSGWWLMPPALGTKIIPMAIPDPSTIASW